MIPSSFGSVYSEIYDSLYQDKSYSAECDLIEKFFSKYRKKGKINDILDLGCGTGGHAFEMINRGYSCIGVDLSQGMIDIANEKASKLGKAKQVTFHREDIRTFRTDSKFDAVIMMFAVLGYQTTNDDVKASLKTVRDHLQTGGIFIFDVWFGPAVLNQRPGERVKVIRSGNSQIIRAAGSELDVLNQTCDVNYNIWKIQNDRVVANSKETHRMRFYFARELELFLEMAGLKLLTLEDISKFGRPPSEDSWNIVGVAKAV